MTANANLQPGIIEMMYVAMAEVVKTYEWWTLSTEEALRIAKQATRGRLPDDEIIDEFESLKGLILSSPDKSI